MTPNKLPIIGIIPVFSTEENEHPYKDTAQFVTMYNDNITKSGGLPLGILNNDPSYFDICDAYLWPGGKKMDFNFFPFIADALNNNKPF